MSTRWPLCRSSGRRSRWRPARQRKRKWTSAGHPAAAEPSVGSTETDTTWIAREPVICGEVHGRVLDQAGLQPVAQAFVSLDSSSRGIMTDSLGRFRLKLPHGEKSLLPRSRLFSGSYESARWKSASSCPPAWVTWSKCSFPRKGFMLITWPRFASRAQGSVRMPLNER